MNDLSLMWDFLFTGSHRHHHMAKRSQTDTFFHRASCLFVFPLTITYYYVVLKCTCDVLVGSKQGGWGVGG